MDDDITLSTVELRSAVTTAESTMPLFINRKRARNRRASESEEPREQRLARDKARRRQRLDASLSALLRASCAVQ